MASVSGLFVHPVKSCAARAVRRAAVGPAGLAHDRSWMVVEPDGSMVTARQDPPLAGVVARVHDGVLEVGRRGAGVALRLPAAATDGPRRDVSVWEHTGPAVDAGDAAAAFFTEVVGRPVRLVRVAPDHDRPVDPAWASSGSVGFADGFPVLVISEASLEALNDRLTAPVAMSRFRPNVVIRGCPPHAEDTWTAIRIGDVTLTWAKPCARCRMTTVDPARAVFDGPEPLRTLATYRRHPLGVLFGANHLATEGTLEVGAAVEVLGTQAPPDLLASPD